MRGSSCNPLPDRTAKVELRRVYSHEMEMERALVPADMDVRTDGPAVEDQDVVFKECIKVGPGEKLLGDLPPRDMVHL
jgi:hypothetical protein